jgi:hypothetical protein
MTCPFFSSVADTGAAPMGWCRDSPRPAVAATSGVGILRDDLSIISINILGTTPWGQVCRGYKVNGEI